MKTICDVLAYNDIDKALEEIRFQHRIYLLKERVLLFFYNGDSHYRIYNFNNKTETNISAEWRETFYLSKEQLLAIINSSFDSQSLPERINYNQDSFVDKDMLEPLDTANIKDFSAYKDKKLGSLNMIKILRAKNVKVIRRMLLTDDYAYDNATNFGEGNSMDKFDLINELKRTGTKGYIFRYEEDKKISGSCYSFDYFDIVIK